MAQGQVAGETASSTYTREYPSGLICAFTILSEVGISAQVANAAFNTRRAAAVAVHPSWKAFFVIVTRRRWKGYGGRKGMGNGRGKVG